MTETRPTGRLLYLILAAVLAAALFTAVPSSAYINRGSVEISDPQQTALEVGDSTVMSVSPYEEQHYPGCGMAECPESCGEKDCIVYVNGQQECTCNGTVPTTYRADVRVSSSDSSVAAVTYNNAGSVIITAVGAGSAEISVQADFREYQSASRTVTITVAGGSTDDSFPFVDVAADRWSRPAIAYVYKNGYFAGTSADTFSPETEMTRAMFVAVLWRISGAEAEPGTSAFADVPADAYYAEAVKWASDNGIVAGTSETAFSPDQTITREQFVTMLYRYTAYMTRNTRYSDNCLDPYTDRDQVADYAVIPMKWAVTMDIISGTTETTLSPGAGATREQAAQLLMNYDTDFVYTSKAQPPTPLPPQ